MATSVKTLKALVSQINSRTDSPAESWARVDGKLEANIGNYYLDGAYGGYALYRMINTGGGVSDVSGMGHQPKRDLETFLRGFLAGIESVGR